MSGNDDGPAAAMGEGAADNDVVPTTERDELEPLRRAREATPTLRYFELASTPIPVLLSTIPLLRATPDIALERLALSTVREPVDVGHVVVREGDPSFDVFFIVNGLFDVLTDRQGPVLKYMRTLRPGESFGELGVVYGVQRTSTVRCTATGQLLRIPGPAFLDALDAGV